MPLDHTVLPEATPETNGAARPGTERRQLLRQAGLGAALLGTIGTGATSLLPRRADAATVTDGDILNFALNLEYLEAEFYLRAVTGKGLSASQVTGTGTPGAVSGGRAVPFKNPYLKTLAENLAADELAHVLFLREALDGYKVARPAISLDYSFQVLARAAGFATAGQYFDPFYSDYTFLLGAYIFEDVGVTAYLGAAGLITNKAYLTAAGGILGVEAYHAGAIRSFIVNFEGDAAGTIAGQISKLRATLSQAADDVGPEPSPNVLKLAPTDANSVAFPRTTRQVLNVVYGGVNATKGLFFPAGMNGLIK